MLNHISSITRQRFFISKPNPKNLDPSYKMDLDFWDCFGREKPKGLFWKGKTHGIVLEGKTHEILIVLERTKAFLQQNLQKPFRHLGSFQRGQNPHFIVEKIWYTPIR